MLVLGLGLGFSVSGLGVHVTRFNHGSAGARQVVRVVGDGGLSLGLGLYLGLVLGCRVRVSVRVSG